MPPKILLCCVLLAACDSPVADAEPGRETGACLQNRCWGELACLSDVCVDPDFDPVAVHEEELHRGVQCGALPDVVGGVAFDVVLDVTVLDTRGPFGIEVAVGGTGLSFDVSTMRLSGTIAESGIREIPISVTGEGGLHRNGSCAIKVEPGLSIDPLGPCFDGSEPVLAQVAGGTEDAITCDAPGGLGNGSLPDGFRVDPKTCEIEGDRSRLPFGVTPVMVRARQSGAEAWLPHCLINPTTRTYVFRPASGSAVPTLREPLTESFVAGERLSIELPTVRVTTPECADGCAYRYRYTASSPLFDGTDFDAFVSATPMVSGVEARLAWLSGSAVPESLQRRTWVYGPTITLCMDSDASKCEGEALYTHGETVALSVIMSP